MLSQVSYDQRWVHRLQHALEDGDVEYALENFGQRKMGAAGSLLHEDNFPGDQDGTCKAHN